jgi:hypothetical protein
LEKRRKSYIGEKTFSEQLAEGLLKLKPTQKIIGEGVNEQIVEKSLAEQVAEGLLKLDPRQKLDGERLVRKSALELLNEELISLDDYKKMKIQFFSDLALEKRRAILPDYKLLNAAIGVYDEETSSQYKATIQAFRDEFYRIKKLIEQARMAKAVEAVSADYPRALVAVRESPKTRKK